MDDRDIYQPNRHKKIEPPPTPDEAARLRLITIIVLIAGSIGLAAGNELWGLAVVIPLIVFENMFYEFSRPRNRAKTAVIMIFVDAAVIGMVWGSKTMFPIIFEAMKIGFPAVLFGSGLFSFGAWGTITIIISRILCKKRCTVPVTAYCSRLQKQKHKGNKHSHVYYTSCPVYTFTYKGFEYETYGSDLKRGEESPLHQYYQIKIDPENPEVSDDGRYNTSSAVGLILLCLILAAGGIALIVLGCTPGLLVINDPETAADRTYRRY